MAGSGEVIPNGSVHYNVIHEETSAKSNDSYVVRAIDPTPYKEVGTTKGHPGKFRVRLRFGTEGEAREALNRAADSVHLDRPSKTWEVIVDSTVLARTRKQAEEPPPNKWAQIKIDW